MYIVIIIEYLYKAIPPEPMLIVFLRFPISHYFTPDAQQLIEQGNPDRPKPHEVSGN